MKCSRCTAELPASATRCPQCGQQVTPNSQNNTFSYLPAGAPPWPTSVPASIQALAPGAAQVRSTPMASSTPSSKSSNPLGKMLSTALVVVVVALLGVGATMATLAAHGQFSPKPAAKAQTKSVSSVQPVATPTASTSQLPASTSSKQLKDTDVNMALQYPGEWQNQPKQKYTDIVLVTLQSQPQLDISFLVVRYTEKSSQNFKDGNDINMSDFYSISQNEDVQNLQQVTTGPSKQTIGGVDWNQAEGTFDTTSGVKMHMVTLAVLHNKQFYNIVIYTPDEIYTQATTQYISPILKSAQFLT